MAMNPRLLRPRATGYDPAAQVYFNAVAVADGQQLETAVKKAINDFVVGCKRDGIWSSIKASCLLMGARTLSGALTPLVGTAPTNNGPFVSGDYNRKTGLVGNGSTKYLDSNRDGNADPQNNFHACAWLPTQTLNNESIPRQLIGSVGNTWVGYNTATGVNGPSQYFVRARQTSSSSQNFAENNVIKAVGVSRSTSSSITIRTDGVSTSVSIASAAAGSPKFFVLAANDGTGAVQHSPARLAFYSIGESLDLALLDSRVSTLYTAIGAAIP